MLLDILCNLYIKWTTQSSVHNCKTPSGHDYLFQLFSFDEES